MKILTIFFLVILFTNAAFSQSDWNYANISKNDGITVIKKFDDNLVAIGFNGMIQLSTNDGIH